MKRPYLQLQFLVLILALTAILGRLITLPAPLLVLWRTALSACIIFLWLSATKRAPLRMPTRDTLKVIMIGVILGLHWTLFFASIQISNISICLAGMASTSFFTSLTEPLLEKRRPRISELLLGLMIIPGLALIAGASWDHATGLGYALASAFFASLFPVMNRQFRLKGTAPQTLTLYEMVGASITCFIVATLTGTSVHEQLPAASDWFWMAILVGICTVWAFSFHIHLLKQFTAFTTNLAINFEPIYGILLAAIIFQEYKDLGLYFYIGASFILAANLIHGLINRNNPQPDSAPGELPVNE